MWRRGNRRRPQAGQPARRRRSQLPASCRRAFHQPAAAGLRRRLAAVWQTGLAAAATGSSSCGRFIAAPRYGTGGRRFQHGPAISSAAGKLPGNWRTGFRRGFFSRTYQTATGKRGLASLYARGFRPQTYWFSRRLAIPNRANDADTIFSICLVKRISRCTDSFRRHARGRG